MAGEEITQAEAARIAARIEEGIEPGPGQDEVDAIVAALASEEDTDAS